MKNTHHLAVKAISNVVGRVDWQNKHVTVRTFKWGALDKTQKLQRALADMQHQYPDVKVVWKRRGTRGMLSTVWSLRILIPIEQFTQEA